MSKLIEYGQIEVVPEGALEIVDGGVLKKRAQQDLIFLTHFDVENVHSFEEVTQKKSVAILNLLDVIPPTYPAGNSDFGKCLKSPGNNIALGLGVMDIPFGQEMSISFYFQTALTATGGVPIPLVSTFRQTPNDNGDEVFKIEWINNDIKFTAKYPDVGTESITASSVLSADTWYFIECIFYFATYERIKIKINGVDIVSGLMFGADFFPGTSEKAIYILFDPLANNPNRNAYVEEIAIKLNNFEEVITAPRNVFTVGEIVAKWFGDSDLDGSIWKPSTIQLLNKILPLATDPLLDLDWRIAAAGSKAGVEFAGDKVDINDLVGEDDVSGRWSGLEITYPGGNTQYELPAGAIDFDPPDVSEFYSSPEEVIHRTGVVYGDLGAESEDDLFDVLTEWLREATDYINQFTGQIWTSLTVPKAVESVCAGVVSSMVVIAQQRRKSPLVKISDFNIKMVEDDVITDDVTKVLKKYVDSTSFVGVSLGVTVDEEDDDA